MRHKSPKIEIFPLGCVAKFRWARSEALRCTRSNAGRTEVCAHDAVKLSQNPGFEDRSHRDTARARIPALASRMLTTCIGLFFAFTAFRLAGRTIEFVVGSFAARRTFGTAAPESIFDSIRLIVDSVRTALKSNVWVKEEGRCLDHLDLASPSGAIADVSSFLTIFKPLWQACAPRCSLRTVRLRRAR